MDETVGLGKVVEKRVSGQGSHMNEDREVGKVLVHLRLRGKQQCGLWTVQRREVLLEAGDECRGCNPCFLGLFKILNYR